MPEEIFFLFAHEPYFPPHGLREVNCTIVAAATLLHPRVRQPGGARIHRLLHTGPRTHGEIVPLATLTHELDGGAGWAQVGDWEKVVADLLSLTRFGSCDSLGLALPALERALVCSGPHSRVINLDPATGQRETHGPARRAAVLAELTHNLHTAQDGRELWPGTGLLPALPPLAGPRAADGTDEPATVAVAGSRALAGETPRSQGLNARARDAVHGRPG